MKQVFCIILLAVGQYWGGGMCDDVIVCPVHGDCKCFAFPAPQDISPPKVPFPPLPIIITRALSL